MRIIYIPKKTSPITTIKYGLLYNWFAITDARNIANTGWHVPTTSELDTLRTYLGGSSVAGGKLKETGTLSWATPNTGATNEVGFNGRGAGYLTYGGFGNFNNTEWIGTTDNYVNFSFYGMVLNFNTTASDKFFVDNSFQYKRHGLSARLIKDSTSLTHGQTGTYTGNDGKVYRTICIGTQEYTADNLAETKYRTLDDITEETNTANWPSISTGAMAAFNNDWSNV